jgi:hypothetical protein
MRRRRWPRPWSSWAGWSAGTRCRFDRARRPAPVGRAAPADCAVRAARRCAGGASISRSGFCAKADGLLRPGPGAGRDRALSATARGHGAHGSQRLGEVDAAHHALGRTGSHPGRRECGRNGTPALWPHADLIRSVGLVPQDPGILLYGESVKAECDTSDKVSHLPEGTTWRSLERVLPGMPADRHPRDLSEGQRLAWRWPLCWRRPPPCSCSTSRRGASTTRARTA